MRRRLDGLQIRPGIYRKEKKYLSLPKIEPKFLGLPGRRLMTTMTELSGSMIITF
jgi:hypothetical protein